jgi:hypothetical protein
VYLDEKHIASMAEHSLINHYRFESCSDYKNKIMEQTLLIDKIEELLDFNDQQTKINYMSWDKGDCSVVGLCEILLSQELRKHRQENGEWSDSDYEIIKLRYE